LERWQNAGERAMMWTCKKQWTKNWTLAGLSMVPRQVRYLVEATTNHMSLWGVIDISMTHWNYFRGHFSYLLNGRNWAFCPLCLTIHQVLTYFTELSWFCGEISSQEVQHGEWGRDFKFKKTCIWTT
jgi:hypothetical protein